MIPLYKIVKNANKKFQKILESLSEVTRRQMRGCGKEGEGITKEPKASLSTAPTALPVPSLCESWICRCMAFHAGKLWYGSKCQALATVVHSDLSRDPLLRLYIQQRYSRMQTAHRLAQITGATLSALEKLSILSKAVSQLQNGNNIYMLERL